MNQTRRTLRTLRALAQPVGGSMAISVLGLAVMRRLAPAETLRASNDVVGNYLQTVGSIYAVLLAFVTFVVWNQFNEARGHVEEESNELLDLFRTARGLPEPARTRVHDSVRDYLATVLDSEWPEMACGAMHGPGAGATILDRLWEAVQDIEPPVEPDRSVFREVLRRLDDISDVRSRRIGASLIRLPTALRILLYTGGVTVIGSMYLFAVDSFAVHAIITAALAGAIAHVLYVVEDLDRCYHGHWQVPRDAFERVQAQLTQSADVKHAA